SIDLNPNASGFINNGTITANDSLTLNGQGGGQFNNTNGTITLFSDGLVQLTNAALVSGGTLMSSATTRPCQLIQLSQITGSTLNGGTFAVPAGNTGSFNGVTNLARIRIEDGATGVFAGTTTDTGSIAILAGASNATLQVAAGGATFSGAGS